MEHISDVNTWFRGQIMYSRIIGCIMCSIALQICVSFGIVVLLNADVLSPLQWFKDGFAAFVSLSTIGYLMVMFVLSSCLVFSFVTQLKLEPTMFSTMSEKILFIAHPWRIFIILGYTFAGALAATIYLRMSGNPLSTMLTSCEMNYRCVNRRHVFLMCSACFVGFIYGFGLIVSNDNCIRFPIIQRKKYVQVKSALYTKIVESFCEVLVKLKWFLIVYALIGFCIENFLAKSFNCKVSSSSTFALLYDFLDAKLWCTLLLVDTAVHLLFASVSYLLTIFITEKFSFLIETSFEYQANCTLSSALNRNDCSILKYLSFLDLSLSSQYSVNKRKTIFSLSQPGGHPRHWNAISESCLQLIRDMTERIVNFCEPQSKQSYSIEPVKQDNRSSPKTSTDIAYEMWRSQRFGFHQSPNQTGLNSKILQLNSPTTSSSFDFVTSLKGVFWQESDKLLKAFLKIPLVAFFFMESVETSVQKIFVSCQLQIWAIEALSFLVAASFHEDKYGVVQKDLSTILVSLLDLQQALNRLQKMPGITTKDGPLKNTSKTVLLWTDQHRASLKFAVKSALYRIVITFGSHLNISISLQVPSPCPMNIENT